MQAIKKWRIIQFSLFRSQIRREGHTPVLVETSIDELDLLNLEPNGKIIDCTFGAGGHTSLILEKSPTAIVYAVDQDETVFERDSFKILQEKYGNRIVPCTGNFRNLSQITKLEAGSVSGILMDLGMSSMQVDSTRGFSFRAEFNGDLDMRMSKSIQTTAKDIVNNYGERHLADIFQRLGEESCSQRIAGAIVRARNKKTIDTSLELANVVAPYARKSPGGGHPATRVFQALRMFVNDEINSLMEGLSESERLLKSGGKLVILTYHSLEDRLVKYFMRYCSGIQTHNQKANEASLLLESKKVKKPTRQEVVSNPRSRSAKLRCATRVGTTFNAEYYFKFVAPNRETRRI